MTRTRSRQGGYTLVETIVAVAVGAIVMAAIFPAFLLLYRVETAWGGATQARATGLIAEESLVRDLRAYHVDSTSPDLSLSSPGERNYSIDYAVDDSDRLIRTVRVDGVAVSSSIVAHGIHQVVASCSGDPATIRLVIWTTGIGGPEVRLRPNLLVTPRNPQACP
jgi:prepilin-type N-terminal cleavage/methylation domain-containing protein